MSFESPRSAGYPEPLPDDVAHVEANMVRTKLRELVDHEPTARDYDRALLAIEEMRQLAEEEPQFDKILNKLFRIGNKYFNEAADSLLWLATLGARPDESDRSFREHTLQMFHDAAGRLDELKKKAETESQK